MKNINKIIKYVIITIITLSIIIISNNVFAIDANDIKNDTQNENYPVKTQNYNLGDMILERIFAEVEMNAGRPEEAQKYLNQWVSSGHREQWYSWLRELGIETEKIDIDPEVAAEEEAVYAYVRNYYLELVNAQNMIEDELKKYDSSYFEGKSREYLAAWMNTFLQDIGMGYMPQYRMDPKYNLVPQYFNLGIPGSTYTRNVQGSIKRWDLYNSNGSLVKDWTTSIEGGTAYCANFGSPIQFGTFDPTEYLIPINSDKKIKLTSNGVIFLDNSLSDSFYVNNGYGALGNLRNFISNLVKEAVKDTVGFKNKCEATGVLKQYRKRDDAKKVDGYYYVDNSKDNPFEVEYDFSDESKLSISTAFKDMPEFNDSSYYDFTDNKNSILTSNGSGKIVLNDENNNSMISGGNLKDKYKNVLASISYGEDEKSKRFSDLLASTSYNNPNGMPEDIKHLSETIPYKAAADALADAITDSFDEDINIKYSGKPYVSRNGTKSKINVKSVSPGEYSWTRSYNLDHPYQVHALEHWDGQDGNWVPGYGVDTDGFEMENNRYSFIFSATEEAYGFDGAKNVKKKEYFTKYSMVDVQSAYWILLEYDKNPKLYGSFPDAADKVVNSTSLSKKEITKEGIDLAKRAVAYEEFYKLVEAGKYKATIENPIKDGEKQAQVIVNKEKNEYIIGPFTMNYGCEGMKDELKEYTSDFNYVRSMIVRKIDEQGNDLGGLEYSISKSDFEIICENPVHGGNGMDDYFTYPESGTNFFFKIKANKVEGANALDFGAIVEHISTSSAAGNNLISSDNIYRYSTYYDVGGELKAEREGKDVTEVTDVQNSKTGKLEITATYTGYFSYSKWLRCKSYDEEGNTVYSYVSWPSNPVAQQVCLNDNPNYDRYNITNAQGEVVESDVPRIVYKLEEQTKGLFITQNNDGSWTTKNTAQINIHIPYIKMDEEPSQQIPGQTLTLVGTKVASVEGEGEVSAELKYEASNNATRKYVRVETKNNIGQIKITMDLGGYVWVDAIKGKESEIDSRYNLGDNADSRDEIIRNVKVRISRVIKDNDGNIIDTPIVRDWKTTEENAFNYGDESYASEEQKEKIGYVFRNLWPFYDYFIEFEYNGQYYEPVQYVSPDDENNGWGSDDWKINSNATDLISKDRNIEGRTEFNDRFDIINSYSKNYIRKDDNSISAPSYTRMDMLGWTLDEDGKYHGVYHGTNVEFPNNNFIDNGGHIMPTDSGVIDEHGNIINETLDASKLQFANDSMIIAHTGLNNGFDYYVPKGVFALNGELSPGVINASDYINLKPEDIVPIYENDAAYNINLGLHAREAVDISVNKDVDKVTMEINGKTHEYTYDTLDAMKCDKCGFTTTFEDLFKNYRYRGDDFKYHYKCKCGEIDSFNASWDIEVRLSDRYNNPERYKYERPVNTSDYLYKVSMYGSDPAKYGKDKSDELEVFVTYKIAVRNLSNSVKTRIDELVDYYDDTFTIVPERSYIEVGTGESAVKYQIVLDQNSACGSDVATGSKTYIRGIGKNDGNNALYLNAGQQANFYVTFRVNKDANEYITIGEKKNLVELNGYSTEYHKGTKIPNIYDGIDGRPNGTPEGTKAGILDLNSTPGNVTDAMAKNIMNGTSHIIENDTDKAPDINIKINEDDDENRVISGFIWEDDRTEQINVDGKNARVGNGKVDNAETQINGVTVQLVEIMANPTDDEHREFVWREFGTTNEPGKIQTEEEKFNSPWGGSGNPNSANNEETPIINGYINGKLMVSNYSFGNDATGKYAFKSFIPGNYVIRFIYGDTVRTVLPSEKNISGLDKGQNAKSYNGQDYKSTTYQVGVNQEDRIYEWRTNHTYENGTEKQGELLTVVPEFKSNATNNATTEVPLRNNGVSWAPINADQQIGYLYDITGSDTYNGTENPNVSDAKDIATRRKTVNNYSSNGVMNAKAEVLASHRADYENLNDTKTALHDLILNTQMDAETGLMVVEFEKDLQQSDGLGKRINQINNVNLGLEERPRAQLTLNKEVTNVKVTLANGSILFDANSVAANVLWRNHIPYAPKYKPNYTRDILVDIENKRENETAEVGLIQLTMDEEIMHGATIDVDYKLTVKNVGDYDYDDLQFYYKAANGAKVDASKIVKTSADNVIDYVENNMQFNVDDNNNIWEIKSSDDLINSGYVNGTLKDSISKYNSVIITNVLKEKLEPDEEKTVPLKLSQLITSQNTSDDLTYRNMAEIVETSNDVGRRMQFSVVGNQDPSSYPKEVDTDTAQIVKILPPFGETLNIIAIVITIVFATAILVVGIILIKKKILK